MICGYCAGDGYVDQWKDGLNDWEDMECPECGGSGEDDDDE